MLIFCQPFFLRCQEDAAEYLIIDVTEQPVQKTKNKELTDEREIYNRTLSKFNNVSERAVYQPLLF
ncbi:MAG: hypothetical protein D3904_05300 [Candidatus Electrothrix sp. EH2]|nr:hypothetical protein [Candidatus Electrothrix sp. EH2]